MSVQRRKGTAFETGVVRYMRDGGLLADRLARTGVEDEGDILAYHAGRFFVVEAKATRSIDLAGAVDEAEVEARNFARHRRGADDIHPAVAVIKRRNRGIGDAYVVMSLRTFVGIVREDGNS